MKLRDKMTSDFVGLLLDFVRNNGWTTCITDDAGINRRDMNRKNFRKLKVFQLLRLLVALCHHCSRQSEKEFMRIWWKLGLMIMTFADDEQYFDFVDEKAR